MTVAELVNTVLPPPTVLSIKPPDQLNVPAITTVPVPSNVPPDRFKTVLVSKKLAPFKVSVLAGKLRVTAPPLVLPTIKPETVALTLTATA